MQQGKRTGSVSFWSASLFLFLQNLVPSPVTVFVFKHSLSLLSESNEDQTSSFLLEKLLLYQMNGKSQTFMFQRANSRECEHLELTVRFTSAAMLIFTFKVKLLQMHH